ncbi:MAG: MotA/TolQ/ExbB proton channel family protein [Pseudomonadota bacterium]
MKVMNGVVNFMVEGGIWMTPILVVGVVGFAIAIERYVKLNRVERDNRRMWEELQPLIAQKDFAAARELAAGDQSTVSQLLLTGLECHAAGEMSREEVELAMEEEMMAVSHQLEKRTPYLALYANLATLMGLLGTIIGLISAFDAVANAAPAEKANLLSASISVAMNCTAFGLIVSIPLMALHLFLSTKANNIVDSLEMASLKTLNVISNTMKRSHTND